MLILIAVDYVSGIFKAIYEKKSNSTINAKGIIRKIGILALVGVSAQLDYIMGHTGAIRTVVIYFFVASEGLNIIENWSSMGLPIPQKLNDVLQQLRKDN